MGAKRRGERAVDKVTHWVRIWSSVRGSYSERRKGAIFGAAQGGRGGRIQSGARGPRIR